MAGNAEVAGTLLEIADLLDLLGERFKPEAYRRAARSLEALPESLEAIAARGDLRTIPGVGEAISEKIRELLRTGSISYLERLRSQVPSGVLELMRLPGVGPKTARRFWVELHIGGPQELSEAIATDRLAGVKGFAEKKISQLRTAAEAAGAPGAPARVPIEDVWPLARSIVASLRAVPSVREVAVAGSFRRARETVGDLDVLVTAETTEPVFDAFSRHPTVREVRLRGPTKETVVLTGGLQVDLRVVEPESFGAALQYFTGSKDHNVRLRSLARERGLKINEYGVYRGDERIGGRTEEEVYAALGLAWIPPELREDRGEIARAAAGELPRLVEEDNLVSEPHVHLSGTPTTDELDRLLAAARRRSIQSVGIVAAIMRDGEQRWSAPPEILDRLRRAARGVRTATVVELEGQLPSQRAGGMDDLRPDYLVLAPRPGASASETELGFPVMLVAHAGGAADSARPSLELAGAYGAAVEVGPGSDRLDSTGARVALASGLALSLPMGLAEPEESPLREVALGFARRAGATAEKVLNARELAAPSQPAPPSSGRGPRPRRPSHRRR